jgi:predicted transcriptional regulator
MNVRAWLYRVAHNRCIDHLRRPVPAAAEVFEVSRKPLQDPLEEAQRREDLARLVHDISQLPEQQRSALLMRELDGMAYTDLAAALDVTVPAVKSLLVRARVGLVDAAEARDADCQEIRDALVSAYDRGVKASSRARRHMRSCTACTDYRAQLRGVQRSFASLMPVGLGPVALVAKLLGIGGAGGSAAAGGGAAGGTAAVGTAAAGSGAAAVSGGLATVTACKVAVVVCTAAITAGGAVEANHIAHQRNAPRPAVAATMPAAAPPEVASLQTTPAGHHASVVQTPVPRAQPADQAAPFQSAAGPVAAVPAAPTSAAPAPEATAPVVPADATPAATVVVTPDQAAVTPSPAPTPDPNTGTTAVPATGSGATATPTPTADPTADGGAATPTPVADPTGSPVAASGSATPTATPTPAP